MGKLVTLTDEEHFDLLIVLASYNCQLAREIRDLKYLRAQDRRQSASVDNSERMIRAMLSDLERYQRVYEQLRRASTTE